jgi:hypothetical protein
MSKYIDTHHLECGMPHHIYKFYERKDPGLSICWSA